MEHLETAIKALEVKLSSDEIAAVEKPYQPHGVRGFT
jgi:aryl-alcohol dehydrogenase-like predicted oxidoreductase